MTNWPLAKHAFKNWKLNVMRCTRIVVSWLTNSVNKPFKFCHLQILLNNPPTNGPQKKKQVKQPKINRPLGWVINLWLAVYFVLPFEKEKLSWMSLKKVTKFLYLTLFLHLFWGLYSLIVKVPKRLQLWSHGEHQSTNDHDPTHWMALIVHLLSSFIIVTFLFLKYN